MNLNFTKPFVLFALSASTLMAQTGRKAIPVKKELAEDATEYMHVEKRGCATIAPDAQWENQFQQLIAQQQLASKGTDVQVNYTIPVVIHIIHGGQAIGTYPNLSVAQATSQVTVLNNDFAGAGLNVANYPATAFTSYATAAGLPAANKDANGRPKISNFNISFCLATIDKNGNTMAVPGIDRVNYNTFTLTAGVTSANPADASNGDPNGDQNPAEFMNYMNSVCKPQTIWDPTKYLNIWVTDVNANAGLLGFATFPAASGLTGVPGGTGTSTTDGLWCWGRSFGNVGTLQSPYNKGRTAVHEIGHWLGLRHIWGDGDGQTPSTSCLTDYCLDTPPASADNGGAPTYPFNANSCTSPSGTNNTTANGVNGEMFMNFMDYTNDASMYMFTEDQRTRAQTAMANGTYRKFLGTHGLCATGSSTPATAAFTMTNSACNGSAVSVTNNSTGNPTPTYTWSASPSTGVTFSPNANATAPTISFANTGSYVITLAAKSGTTAVSTKTNAITTSTCAAPPVACIDTLTNLLNTDTLVVIRSGGQGYAAGTNDYGDIEKAEFYKSTGLAGSSKITGAMVLFYREGTVGTKGSGNLTFRTYNGTLAGGPSGAAVQTTTASLSSIIAGTPTTNVTYCGDPTIGYASPIILPYKVTFPSTYTITSDFYMSVSVPNNATDTVALFMTSGNTATVATGWEKWSDNSWHSFNDGTTNSWQINASLAILPIIQCTTVATGIDNQSSIANNIAIFPNPNNGIFNVALTLPISHDITISISNTLGQTVLSHNYKSVTNGVYPIDMSSYNNGVYFITVSSGTDKNVQRVVLTK